MNALMFNSNVSTAEAVSDSIMPAIKAGTDWTVVRATLEAEADHVVPGMSLDAIARIENPHLRAGAILMADLVGECRADRKAQLARLAYSVEVPEAGDLGERAVGTYREATAATTDTKRKAFAKTLAIHIRSLSGFGRVAMVETALSLLQVQAGGGHDGVGKAA